VGVVLFISVQFPCLNGEYRGILIWVSDSTEMNL